MTLNMPEGGNGEACEGCGFTDMHMTTTCLARQNAALRARVAELESTRQLAPPVNAGDERLIDELMAKRAAGLKVAPMGEVAGAWVAVAERMPEDKSRVWFFKGSVRRGYYCSEGFFSEAGMGWAPSEVSHWMPCPGEPAPPVTGAEPRGQG